ncbi:MAG: hypothetical protein SF051_03420 [Elusimicrobiota bacterium]|nr:hypothetical protein [Elusimicrobiota bacterium]
MRLRPSVALVLFLALASDAGAIGAALRAPARAPAWQAALTPAGAHLAGLDLSQPLVRSALWHALDLAPAPRPGLEPADQARALRAAVAAVGAAAADSPEPRPDMLAALTVLEPALEPADARRVREKAAEVWSARGIGARAAVDEAVAVWEGRAPQAAAQAAPVVAAAPRGPRLSGLLPWRPRARVPAPEPPPVSAQAGTMPGIEVNKDYTTHRGLASYRKVFHAEEPIEPGQEHAVERRLVHGHFRRSSHFRAPEEIIAGLRPGALWVDVGMGDGFALAEGAALNPGIVAVGLDLNAPTGASPFHPRRWRRLDGAAPDYAALEPGAHPFHGAFFENAPVPRGVSYITASFSVGVYSRDLAGNVQKMLDMLEPGGVLDLNIIVLKKYKALAPEVITDFVGREGVIGSGEYRRVVDAQANAVADWVKGARGVESSVHIYRGSPLTKRYEVSVSIRLVKTGPAATVPALELTNYDGEKGTIPRRAYRRVP